MDYELWREDVFGQPPGIEPISVRLLPETYELSALETFDHIDRALGDVEIHECFSSEQIGVGLNLIYSNNYGDMCFCYVEAGDDERRIRGIRNLDKLYSNFFDRYCHGLVCDIGNDQHDGKIGFLCYMLWDIFVLYPGRASAGMRAASLDVMAGGLQYANDNCIVSAIHGLGHWKFDEPRAAQILRDWLERPTTRNPAVLDYAQRAIASGIL